ncbi:MAG: energy transducer TonB, partial [Woeseiaceae bacterium]|nr:energy transducer TonB [Woeseiaceae bacterium]
KLAMEARAATDSGDFDTARQLLATASTLEGTNSDVVNAQKQLASARSEAAPPKEAPAATPPASQPRKAAAATVTAPAPAPAPAEPVEKAPATVASDATQDPEAADDAAAANDTVAEEQQDAEETPTAVAAAPVMVSSLKRLKYVAPKYPRAAQRRNLSGWVDVLFTVKGDGSVKDVEVQDSEPGDVFANSAIRAVEKWEFEPVIENGSVVEKRAGVRMMFALE